MQLLTNQQLLQTSTFTGLSKNISQNAIKNTRNHSETKQKIDRAIKQISEINHVKTLCKTLIENNCKTPSYICDTRKHYLCLTEKLIIGKTDPTSLLKTH